MSIKGKSAFIIESDLSSRLFLQLVLSQHGVRTMFANRGGDLFRPLKWYAGFDIIIIDLAGMNNRTGFELYDDLRNEPELASIPVAAISSLDPTCMIAKSKARGLSGFIAKPIDRAQFPVQLAKLMKGEEVWDGPVNGLEAPV